MRLTEAEFTAMAGKKLAPMAKLQALGRKKSGEMNKSEAAFDARLAAQLYAGEILWYAFEAITLKLAHDCRLTVDFFVLNAANELQAIDVKGAKAIVQDDAKIKMKLAADKFPWPFFYAFPVKGGGWTIEQV